MLSLLKRADEQETEEERKAVSEIVEEKKRDLTEEQLDALLHSLDPDRAAAAEKYATIHAMLIRFFAFRRCKDADKLADVTIDRVARNARAGKVTQGKLEQFIMGVARNVAHEAFREQDKHKVVSPEELTPSQQSEIEKRTASQDDSAQPDEQRDECMRRCFDGLGADEAEMIIIYSAGKHELKLKLAEFLNISVAALRLRIVRLRKKLENCVQECMGPAQA